MKGFAGDLDDLGRSLVGLLEPQELGGFMAALRTEDTTAARALEFTILTAARTSEAIGARWNEIDLDKKIWTVPAILFTTG